MTTRPTAGTKTFAWWPPAKNARTKTAGRRVAGSMRLRVALWAFGVAGAAATTMPPEEARGQPAPADTVALEEALELSLVHSPQLAQSLASLTNAGSARRRAWGSFLPNLSVAGGASVQSQNRFDPTTQRVVTGSADSYNGSLNLSYQLFQGGRKFSELRRTESGILEAEARMASQRFTVLFQTRNLFVNALRQSELAQVAEARVARADESLEITRTRVRVGTGTRSDSLRARLELANARQALLQTRNQLRAAQFALGRQVGARGPVAPMLPGNLDPVPLALSEEEIVALAESTSPAVQAAQAAASAASSAERSARSSYLPSVSASFGSAWANQQPAFSGGTTSWNFRTSMSYTLFDGFQRSQNVSQASESQRVARLAEDDARRGVRQDVDAALRTLETQEQAIAIAREAVVVAEEDLRLIRERYAVQMATVLDMITSQVALDQAEADLVSARYDYVVAKAELESIVGRAL